MVFIALDAVRGLRFSSGTRSRRHHLSRFPEVWNNGGQLPGFRFNVFAHPFRHLLPDRGFHLPLHPVDGTMGCRNPKRRRPYHQHDRSQRSRQKTYGGGTDRRRSRSAPDESRRGDAESQHGTIRWKLRIPPKCICTNSTDNNHGKSQAPSRPLTRDGPSRRVNLRHSW